MGADDYLKKVLDSDVFSRLGHRLRTTVGIGVGSVELTLERYDLHPGDTLRADIALRLPEPIDAKRLSLTIRATQRLVRYAKDASGNRSMQNDRVTVFRQTRELAGERSYQDGETYRGEIILPADVLEREREPEGALGAVTRAVSTLTQGQRLPLEWQVMALVEIPWKRNLKKIVDVTVSP